MNNYVCMDARLVDAPNHLPNISLTEIRFADNPTKKTDNKGNTIPARFVTGKAWGEQSKLVAKLSKLDVISVAGELGIEAYTDKEGNVRQKDVLRISSFKVQKSESFFAKAQEQTEPESNNDLPF